MSFPLTRGGLRSRLAVLVSLGLLAGLAACSGDEPDAQEPSAEASSDDQSRGGGTATLTWPLTGEPVDGELPDHPVMAVKIDNADEAQPQAGLSEADMVTEELVEGGITRYNAFYYSQVPDLVGPVRSIRASDIGIVKPAEAVLVAAGAAIKTRALISGANITSYNEGAPGYERAGDRVAPHDLMVRLPALAASLDKAEPPPPYLDFGANEMEGGRPAPAFDVVFSGAHTTSFKYEEGTGYTRPGSIAEQGDDFVADTVLVLRVKEGDAGYLDPAGNPVPLTIYEGKGDVMLFHDGKVIEGTWSKDELKSPLQLTTSSGDTMTVPPGNTWIELAPNDAAGGSVEIGG